MTTPDRTERGFRVYAEITDSKRSRVRVQESSAATRDCVWIFCNNADPSYGLAGVVPSPHLTVDQARVVRDALNEFINEFGGGS